MSPRLACIVGTAALLAAAAVKELLPLLSLCRGGRSVAVYYDAENIPESAFGAVMGCASEIGDVRQVRVYANPEILASERWRPVVKAAAVTPCACKGRSAGKNSSDINIAADVVEDLLAGRFADYVIASDDSDFTPVAQRVRSHGAFAHGVGVHKASSTRIGSAYDTWRCVGGDIETRATRYAAAPSKESELDEETLQRLIAAVRATRCKDGWSKVKSIEHHLSSVYHFTAADLGYGSTYALLDAAGVFTLTKPSARPAKVHPRR